MRKWRREMDAYEEILRQLGGVGDFEKPVGFLPGAQLNELLPSFRRLGTRTIGKEILRAWPTDRRHGVFDLVFGLQLFEYSGIRFGLAPLQTVMGWARRVDLGVVAGADYRRLYRAFRTQHQSRQESAEPILSDAQRHTLWKNCIEFLSRERIENIERLGGRARRGVVLSGPPGNGKTMVCRWLRSAAQRQGIETRQVTVEALREATSSCGSEEEVRDLFVLSRPGIIFFDDMDGALRDRNLSSDSDRQSTFLTALDGISANRMVVYVFTTNLPVELIDPAFRRPGRLDVLLELREPNAELRRRLVESWHPALRDGLCTETVVQSTDGHSFAELEEIKNLFIMRYCDTGSFDWKEALEQFNRNRSTLAERRPGSMGFHPIAP